MIDAECVTTCYDSQACKLYERGGKYTIDEKAFALDGGNGLIKHFLPFNQMDREQARQAEKEFNAQRDRAARAEANTLTAAMRTEPSEPVRVSKVRRARA